MVKKFFTIALTVISIFFIYNLNVAGNNPTDDLSVTKVINDYEIDSAGNIRLNYEIDVTNTTTNTIENLEVTDDLKTAFSPFSYEILSLETNNSEYELNPNFDGDIDRNFLSNLEVIEASETVRFYLSVSFNPGGNDGPFENVAFAEGDILNAVPGDDGGDPNDNGGGSDDGGGTDGGGTDGSDPYNDPTEPPDDNLEPRILKYYLINAHTDEIIFEINDGDVIDISLLDTQNLNLIVEVVPTTTGSIVYDVNGVDNFRTENLWPYGLGPHSGPNYESWDYDLIEYNINATAYNENGGQGTVIGEQPITFTFVDSRAGNGDDPGGSNDGDVSNGSGSVIFNIPSSSNDIPDSSTDLDINDSSGRVLAETGFELSDTLIFGLLLIFVVVELNVFELEERYAVHLYRLFDRKIHKNKKANI